jgi:hypothetical protein
MTNYFLGAAMGEETKVLLTLFILLLSAKLMAELFERLRQPAVAGEILAGVLIGPSLLNLATPTAITSILAEIGVAPDFTLADHRGQKTTLFSLRDQSPVVLIFYRGYW